MAALLESGRESKGAENQRACWGQLSEALADLQKAVELGFNPDFAVFDFGTLVITGENDDEFQGYTESNYEFPGHRIVSAGGGVACTGTPVQAAEIARETGANAAVWDEQKKREGATGRVARQAYAKLIKSGYPYPGGGGSDRRTAGVLHGKLCAVHWALDRDNDGVFSTAFHSPGAGAAGDPSIIAGDLRRLDFMFPRVAAVHTAKDGWIALNDAPGGAMGLLKEAP